MSKLRHMYNSIIGKRILTETSNEQYKENVLRIFQAAHDKYMLYDDLSGKVLLLNENEMRKHYSDGNYRDYNDLVHSFDDFCLNSCIEVLKNFSNYSVEEIESEFEKHDILKIIMK